ncbi:MAG: DnaD domain protein [Clostridia bacterium]|nr:DnaD domain protein [Clostridia bacterium]
MKFIQKNNMELSDTLIPDIFILNYMPILKDMDIKVYIYILFLSKKNIELDESQLIKKLQITKEEFSFCIERLQVEDLIVKNSQGYSITDLKELEVNKAYVPKLEPKKTKTETEQEQKRIAAATAINESFFQGIMALSWYTDISIMFEKYLFSEEVMIALFHHCQERKALNKKYVYAVAESWYKGGVKTFEQLEDYFEKQDKVYKIKQNIVKSLRLNRNLTKYEEQYIDKWINEFGYDFDIIELALKKTITKSNPSISYINGILNNWHNKGYKSISQIEQETKVDVDKIIKEPKTKKTLKYQNYGQRDYDDLELYYDNM